MNDAQEFLNRLATSRLLSTQVLAKLTASQLFKDVDAKQAATQLVQRKLISRYQALALLSQPNPKFDYGPYRVVGRHTAGFRAEIFAANHRTTKQPVEIDRITMTAGLAAHIERHCHVRHPNLADCYEGLPDDDDGSLLVVTERMAGTALSDLLSKQTLSQRTACRTVQQVADACWALHSAGLAHGQICPAAVMVVSPTEVRLLRRPGRVANGLTDDKPSELLRSLNTETSAPDDIDNAPTFESDVFALGRLLDVLLPSDEPRSAALMAFIESLLATEPSRRVSHAGAVAAGLEDFARQRNDAATLGEPLDDTSMQIVAEDTWPTQQLRERRRVAQRRVVRSRRWLIGAVVGLLAVAGWYMSPRFLSKPSAALQQAVVATSNDESNDDRPNTPNNDTTSNDTTSGELSNSGEYLPIDAPIVDTSELLWKSPTDGVAIEPRYVLPGAQFFLHVRPAALLSDVQGKRALAALGPTFDSHRRNWESALGVTLEHIDELTLTLAASRTGPPDDYWELRLTDDVGSATNGVPKKWTDGRQVSIANQTIYCVKNHALWPSPTGTLVWGRESVVRAVAEKSDTPPVLRRELELLRAASDSDQLCSLLFAPNFMDVQGNEVLPPQINPIVDGILAALGDDTRGCLLSLHLNEEQFYAELRLASVTQQGPLRQSRELRESIAQIPAKLETTIANVTALDVYWRRLALRAVRMMEFVVKHTRTGADGRTVVANVSLPPQAAHNLLLAIELTTASSQLHDVASSVATSVASPQVRLELNDILATRLSFDIPQQSIEAALFDLATEVNVKLVGRADEVIINIDGPAFEAAGITRNQQVRSFRREDATISELLTDLVMVANPVTTVKAADELDQKLVWVLKPSDEPSSNGERTDGEPFHDETGNKQHWILITTRKAATENGYSLPDAFQPK